MSAIALLPLGAAASASSTTAKPVVYVSDAAGARDLVTIGANGTGTTNLGESPFNVSLSSDGNLIVFDDGTGVRSISSSGPANSSSFLCTGTDPAISPDGTEVTFVLADRIQVGPLSSCSTPTALVPGSTATEKNPAWAPDGSAVVFVSGGDLATAEAGGATHKLMTTNPAESDPAWSPDGSKIAYISDTGADAELFVVDAKGSNPPTRLTSNGVTESSPSWAPGGDEIIYEVGGTLRTISPAGSSLRVLDGATTASRPDWGLAVANVVPPTITPASALKEGAELTAGAQPGDGTPGWTSISGITSWAYQWQRCGSDGAACIDISGATSGTYALTFTDVGSKIRVVVTASTPDGSAPGTSAMTSVVAPAAPNNTAPPTIAGTPIVAGTLTAANGTWTGSNLVFAYQWERCPAGGSCGPISGATANVYVASQDDVGSTLRVKVTATNSVSSAEKTSEVTAAVASRVPASTSPPVISETVSAFDNTISYAVSQGIWTGAATLTFRYQWRRCNATTTTTCADISGATTTSYTPVSADIGSRFRVVVTVTNSFGTATATSEPSSVVAGLSPANSFPPSISGDAETGAILTSFNGTWTGSAPITYTYEWRRCNSAGTSCTVIPGATSQSYIVQAADAGSRIVLAVTAKNVAGTATAVSPPTAVITASTTTPNPPPDTSTRPNNTQAPSFKGVLALGQKLQAANGTWSGTTPMTFSYQWQRCSATGTSCAPIALATNAVYRLAAADVGKRIRLAVTASNVAGNTQEFSLISRIVAKKAPAVKPAAGRKINGTPRVDNLKGGPGNDTIRAGAGNDRINPGAGRDTVFGGAGNDTIQAVDKTRDVIDCGAGRDTVVADKIDVLKGCESIKRR
jgi:hemolysin type calcium-binding protein/WD40 repeat protein